MVFLNISIEFFDAELDKHELYLVAPSENKHKTVQKTTANVDQVLKMKRQHRSQKCP